MLAFSSLGCGEERADAAPAIASCNTYCDAYVAAACTPSTYADRAACKDTECGDIATSPSVCVAAFKTYYDCLGALTKEDLCCDTATAPAKTCTWPDVPCADQYSALLACSGR